MSEAFRRVPFAPAYEVSDQGVVRRATPGTSTKPGRVLRQYVRRDGYRQVTLRHDGKNLPRLVHRLVAVVFHGSQPSPKHEVAHADGDRSNNSANNLRWALHEENAADMIRHGRSQKGERHWNKRLTEDQVRMIRAPRVRRGELAERARMLGISQKHASQIATRKTWNHIED